MEFNLDKFIWVGIKNGRTNRELDDNGKFHWFEPITEGLIKVNFYTVGTSMDAIFKMRDTFIQKNVLEGDSRVLNVEQCSCCGGTVDRFANHFGCRDCGAMGDMITGIMSDMRDPSEKDKVRPSGYYPEKHEQYPEREGYC